MPTHELSAQHLQLLMGVAMGYKNAQIAERIHLPLGTVNNELTKLFREANVDTRNGLVGWGFREGPLTEQVWREAYEEWCQGELMLTPPPLNEKEIFALWCMSFDMTNAQIAELLKESEEAVTSRLHRLGRNKLGSSERGRMVAMGFVYHLFPGDPSV
jgi:DNA-binding CsgD family transcriptional regulator